MDLINIHTIQFTKIISSERFNDLHIRFNIMPIIDDTASIVIDSSDNCYQIKYQGEDMNGVTFVLKKGKFTPCSISIIVNLKRVFKQGYSIDYVYDCIRKLGEIGPQDEDVEDLIEELIGESIHEFDLDVLDFNVYL